MDTESADTGARRRPDGDRRRDRTLQRTINFTDAAVAIALTALVLPLVDFADASSARQSVADLVVQHLGDILSFAVSFLAIALFWRTHRQLHERLADYDEPLLLLNTVWLLAVVFLPFPTARLFVETRLRADSAVFYLGNMFAISLVALAQAWWVRRRPELRVSRDPRASPALLPPAALSAALAVAALIAVASPGGGLLLLALVPVVHFAVARVGRPARR
ncbi:TMEM175 family protein [Micromonospora olivasterospora]|uniref:Putative membrane protein n=1 Tax=Micromonospora olivasterospora TaxID=1880 RepID=A0A562IG17_MICOL|nr:TMEM175 family protein [Micromonospora olivasterospora]TWH69768.1 putative membrane protein [Micromonospora olivasterospora]